jgi:hypothetical protein
VKKSMNRALAIEMAVAEEDVAQASNVRALE